PWPRPPDRHAWRAWALTQEALELGMKRPSRISSSRLMLTTPSRVAHPPRHRLRGSSGELAQLGQALRSHTVGGTRHADRGENGRVGPTYRCGDSVEPDLELLECESVAVVVNPQELPLQDPGIDDRQGGQPLEGPLQQPPALLVGHEGQQNFTVGGAVQ